MSTYKVIQDIEAEDKLLGPLTLRQFVYAAIVLVMGFISFKLAQASWYLALPFLPPIAFFAVLAAPFGHDQSNEVWLLAKIRFFLKPRRRIWNQSDVKQLVTITAPKVVDRPLTKDFDRVEALSRLEALANTLDSRGWAVKNVNVNLFSQPSYVLDQVSSDRLIAPSSIAEDVTDNSLTGITDMMDEQTNATAQHITQMVNASGQARRQQVVQQMQAPPAAKNTKDNKPAVDYWFMNQPNAGDVPRGKTTFPATSAIKPNSSTTPSGPSNADEQAVLSRLHQNQNHPAIIHHVTTGGPADPNGEGVASAALAEEAAKAAAAQRNEALSQRSDLSISTIERQANPRKSPPDDEVVVKLR